MDAGAGPVEGTMSNPTVPENPLEEQPHGNVPHLDPERTGLKWWKDFPGTIFSNAIAGPQVLRGTAAPLIF